MNNTLKELIFISRATGKDPALVQGGGGNTSVKSDDGKYMYIKASGTALKDMTAQQGWRRLNTESVLSVIKDKNLLRLDVNSREKEVVGRLLLACQDDMPASVRPSVESHLHALLDKYVIHLHPLAVCAYTSAKNGKILMEKLFKDEKFPVLWVPYRDPGFSLARMMAHMVGDYHKLHGRNPAIMFLEKHGLFITTDNARTALKLVRKVIRICNSKLPTVKPAKIKSPEQQQINAAKLAVRGGIFAATGRYTSVTHTMNDTIAAFMAHKDAPRLLAVGPLSPDEMVYVNGPALWLDSCDAQSVEKKLQMQIDKGQEPSKTFLVKGTGLFVAGDRKSSTTNEIVSTGSMFIRMCAARFGGVNPLNKRQQDFVNKWESESYRLRLATGENPGALKDRIAVVTGAGSGLGRGIALGLARAGAMIAAMDIDSKACQETVSIIKNELPSASAVALACDVTDENSVDHAFNGLLSQWGGLDILVNAAGVAPAGPLVDLPVDKWRFALEVNLTGYFLMARAAARIMIKQKMGGNIINLSSKSGLEASRNNTPYNATKAGELHMARGWAMELGQFGIRVNCVCPGNVFEGSRIWNAEYIRTCAKKYGIKPEEVIPFYVNKTILKREIKGRDIADAVIFLCSDTARTITGQIIVPDSGQVMVR